MKIPGRVLAIDFGTKRIGFALSDDLRMTGSPLSVRKRTKLLEDLAHIQELISEHEVTTVVFGIPNRLDGSSGPSAERARAFLAELESVLSGVEIHPQDEALSTWEATERMKERGLDERAQKAQVDAYAALVILEEFLGR